MPAAGRTFRTVQGHRLAQEAARLLPLHGYVPKEPDMTPDPEFTWIIDWTLVTVMGNAMPPRDPNDNDDEDEEDEEDEHQNDEPAVIREPDEDE